ncbi:Prefoldin, subunit 4 [Neocallimastix lanati (nom. inval.)]|jgi:prefoldin subunit 4|uniref:Prefoldin subunit 4 n=1 Tax=Neocallimastix californiae TaxID=1754190 RepID=A0A1Y2AMN3_9FUNG|nr:Prefoldin, subunit 4 [Neocallimastix sp. JGI-2020a]ORY23833.1 Prefoldin, subunit 4 [Neocallimastix californiae]|eukprot:ORY23833.1 Prefoldin, subunit 4 [Neocallimastix californiae]
MRLLNESEEVDVEVNWEDQQNINLFSTLNIKLENYEAEFEKVKKEKEYMDDLQQEIEQLELLSEDENEKVKFLIGDAFVEITIPECQELIEEKLAIFEKQLDDYQTKIDDANEQMAKLKAILYGKFGKSINLEKD